MITLQIIGAVLGLLYLYLEYKANAWLWVIGVIMPVVHGILYYKAGLYADASMNLYYVLAGIYGLVVWRLKGGKGGRTMNICHTPVTTAFILVAIYGVLHLFIWWLLVTFTNSTVPVADSFTTALSVVAMWMLSRKYVEQWLVWLVVDVVTACLYFYKGIPVTASLYVLYSVLAVIGYRKWLRQL